MRLGIFARPFSCIVKEVIFPTSTHYRFVAMSRIDSNKQYIDSHSEVSELLIAHK